MRGFFIVALLLSIRSFGADTTGLYNPFANAEKDVKAALATAKAENKNVLLQIGGNWCVWCYKLHAAMYTDSVLKKLVTENFVVYHLNYSKENRNLPFLATLGNPQRFGFPVLVVLDSTGKVVRIQDNPPLLQGNGYSFVSLKTFFERWSPAARRSTLSKNELIGHE